MFPSLNITADYQYKIKRNIPIIMIQFYPIVIPYYLFKIILLALPCVFVMNRETVDALLDGRCFYAKRTLFL